MYLPRNDYGKLEWFNGNLDALNMSRYLIDLSHIWDDVVDKDKEVTENDINYAFSICLILLPTNSFYKLIQDKIISLWVVVVSNYFVANKFEKTGNEDKLIASYGLRTHIANIICYSIVFIYGAENSKPYIDEMWSIVFSEKFNDYKLEHQE